MPDHVEPVLALLKQNPPSGDACSWEIKWDGYRLALMSNTAASGY
jgi:bifunctional non-homologous end joining protein LigD